MSRVAQPPKPLFERFMFPAAAPRGAPSMRSFIAGSLFDLPPEVLTPRRSEPRIRREEDAERWDGLS